LSVRYVVYENGKRVSIIPIEEYEHLLTSSTIKKA
jgi:hypothetical protein